jgi:phosphatidylinositol alpha-mannosyltransferase
VLVPAGDAAALRTALGSLLDDPARCSAIAVAGARRVASLDWPRVVTQVLQVYQTALAADPRRLRGPAA